MEAEIAKNRLDELKLHEENRRKARIRRSTAFSSAFMLRLRTDRAIASELTVYVSNATVVARPDRHPKGTQPIIVGLEPGIPENHILLPRAAPTVACPIC